VAGVPESSPISSASARRRLPGVPDFWVWHVHPSEERRGLEVPTRDRVVYDARRPDKLATNVPVASVSMPRRSTGCMYGCPPTSTSGSSNVNGAARPEGNTSSTTRRT